MRPNSNPVRSFFRVCLSACMLALLLAPSHASAAEAAPGTVVPRGASAKAAFEELAGRGGPRVAMLTPLGSPIEPERERKLLVPAELRFTPVEGRKLIEAVAAARGLKTAWVRNGQWAVLQAGAADAKVERVGKDLGSTDAAVRRDAAWRARWLRDVRVVPLLVKAAKDADAETARQARVSLRRMGWDAVIALEEDAADLLAAELTPGETASNALAVNSAVHTLGNVGGGAKALALLEKALAHQDSSIRNWAVPALANVGGEKALALLEKALADPDQFVRLNAVYALGNVGGEKALALLEKELADQNALRRYHAIRALGNVGGEKALALLEKALTDPDENVRYYVAEAIGRVGGEKALALLEKALAHQDNRRSSAVRALANVGGEKALAMLEKALASKDDRVRTAAGRALANVGDGEKALAMMEKALADQDAGVRFVALQALCNVDGEKALAPLEKALANRGNKNEQIYAVDALGRMGGEKALALLEKALADQDLEMRLHALQALGNVGGEKALAPLEKALADQDPIMRRSALNALGQVDGDKARDLLLAYLAKETNADELSYLRAVLVNKFRGDPAVEKALKKTSAVTP